MRRPCLDCGTPTDGSRCRPCARRRDHARGSRENRGYGPEHRAAREALRAQLPARCGYGCGTVLYPYGAWHAAHVVDGDPSAGYVAACPTCNQRAKRR